jgi:1-acyl-sn-glycerol-3-phosphate acyltransferase
MLFRMPKYSSIMHRFARIVLLPFYSLFVKTKIEGEHFIPRQGPAIIVSNHISFIDPFALGYLCRRRNRQIHFLAKSELFKIPLLGWFLRSCGQIPVERGTSKAADSLLSAELALSDSRLVGIYPESTMPEDLVQLPIKSGAIRLAIKTGAPIIVVGTWGAHDFWRKGKLPRPRIRDTHWLIVAKPYLLDKDADVEASRSQLAEMMKQTTKIAKEKLGN